MRARYEIRFRNDATQSRLQYFFYFTTRRATMNLPLFEKQTHSGLEPFACCVEPCVSARPPLCLASRAFAGELVMLAAFGGFEPQWTARCTPSRNFSQSAARCAASCGAVCRLKKAAPFRRPVHSVLQKIRGRYFAEFAQLHSRRSAAWLHCSTYEAGCGTVSGRPSKSLGRLVDASGKWKAA